MRTTRILTMASLITLPVLLATGLVAAAQEPAPSKDAKEELLPGAKLLYKFPKEVYRIPALLDTPKGPRLLLWVDASEPPPDNADVTRIKPSEFDLICWDVTASKELYRMSSPKDTPPLSPVPPGQSALAHVPGLFGSLALAPDGKRLAYVRVSSYQDAPGKFMRQAVMEINLYDPATRKWRPAVPGEYKSQSGPHILFAPDGTLVILKDQVCAIQDLEKPRPRQLFQLVRSRWFLSNPLQYGIREAVLSPDGSQLAVAADGAVSVYDLGTGREVFQAPRATPEDKTGRGVAQTTERVALAFSTSTKDPQLLAVEVVTGRPKDFALARLFNLKTKKELGHAVLAEQEAKGASDVGPPPWGQVHAYFTSQGEPRVLFEGKLIDGATGKELQQFDAGARLLVSRDGRYLVRLTRAKEEKKKMGVQVWSLENNDK